MLTELEKEQFNTQGFLIRRQMIDNGLLQEIKQLSKNHLQQRIAPFELEAVLKYPGAPQNQSEVGGDTIRRLLLAFSRDESVRQWAKNKVVKAVLSDLFESEDIVLCQSHHNCIMTKQPEFSSETGWHKDIRYWKFVNNNLINTWLALGQENKQNGCLRIIPGSHLWMPNRQQMDDVLFLKKDNVDNMEWLDKAIDVELEAGDVLFFHAALLHAAGNNRMQSCKFSLVFTYHSESNQAIEDTKSTRYDEIPL